VVKAEKYLELWWPGTFESRLAKYLRVENGGGTATEIKISNGIVKKEKTLQEKEKRQFIYKID
jgi:hypothetical protein